MKNHLRPPLFSGVSLGAQNISSRGTTIITQKENKGEYNGINNSTSLSTAWKWNNSSYDWDIYAHVFDQNGKKDTTDNIPIRYANNSTSYQTTDNIPQCTSDYSITSGNTLYSGAKIINQYSCNPYSTSPGLNAGNWYNFAAATAGSNNASTSTETNMPNSICPKGWQLPSNTGSKSYNTLIRTAYGITATGSDSTLRSNTAMSFVRLGSYNNSNGSLNGRGYNGDYWSSTAYSSVYSHHLNFRSESLNPQNSNLRAYGFSIRCVSR